MNKVMADGYQADHIDGNKRNLAFKNLRPLHALANQNNLNHLPVRSSTGTRGVTRDKKGHCFRATVPMYCHGAATRSKSKVKCFPYKKGVDTEAQALGKAKAWRKRHYLEVKNADDGDDSSGHEEFELDETQDLVDDGINESHDELEAPRERLPFQEAATNHQFWRGLRNLGNTCYLNACLQMLSTVPGFTSQLKERGGGRMTRSIVSVSQKLAVKTDMIAVDPRDVKAAMDATTTRFVGFEQQDVHECFIHLVDCIEKELKGNDKETDDSGDVTMTNDEPHPTDDFYLTAEVCLTCSTCRYSR
jgi:hypothetical protein